MKMAKVRMAGGFLGLLFGAGLMSLFFEAPTSTAILASPSASHWLGTDHVGRDLLLRALHGSVISLFTGIVATVVMFVIGGFLGMFSGWVGGFTDAVLMRGTDVLDSLPDLLWVSVIIFLLREQSGDISSAALSAGLVGLGMGLGSWMALCRQARAFTLRQAKADYLVAAQVMGASPLRLLYRHVFPNIRKPMMVFASFQIPNFILFEGALSFFGLGIQTPHASWGTMLNEGCRVMSMAPGLVWVPAFFMVVTLGCFAILVSSFSD